jgi:hypothetical protein
VSLSIFMSQVYPVFSAPLIVSPKASQDQARIR